MKTSLGLLAFAAMLLSTSTICNAQSKWEKQKAPIMTTWGEQVTPENAWQEYPRPSMQRKDWVNLNGVWQYYKRAEVKLDYEKKPQMFDRSILVPYPVESALSGIMDKDIKGNINATHMYRRTFTTPKSFAGKQVLLHFGAVDWRCQVYVNGKLAGKHDGGSDPFALDITALLKKAGEQELQVAVWDPSSDGGQPNGKQSNTPRKIWYTPSSGIWQTVWMEPVDPTHIVSYEPIPDIDNGTVAVTVQTSAECDVTITVKDGDKTVTTATGKSGSAMTLKVPEAKLWSPDAPNLYTLDITASKGGKTVDGVAGYFGMRKFSKGMKDGHPCLMLNNKPLYLFGPLDQGWWPDGLLTPPSYEAMVYDLQVMKDFGMNMVRKHIKLENDLWFDWCDKHGLVVWQDMPSGCNAGLIGSLEYAMENFYRENDAVINAVRHHPSIGAWVVYNEGWGQHAKEGNMEHTRRGINRVIAANHDPGRFVDPVTGWVDIEMADFIDCHSYPSPRAPQNPVNKRIAACGEYGGINYFVKDHMWAASEVNYTTANDIETYVHLFNQYTEKLQRLNKEKGLWMSVYTQITDVEQECNGLMTYDRKVLKVSPEQQADMKARILRTINCTYKGLATVVPAGDEADDITWSYTLEQPSEGWYKTDFDASGWQTGKSGFGKQGRTTWTTSNIWIRRTFTLSGISDEQKQDLRLWMYHDEDADIYINGVLALQVTKFNNEYEQFAILPAALKALKTDGSANVIAISCKQTKGGQYIDCGLKLRQYTDKQ